MTRANVAVVVAHPDDETLWAGGAILLHSEWQCRIVTLCRRSDPDRAPRFERVVRALGAASWEMADLDDGPDQRPLENSVVAHALASVLGREAYDLIITHSPRGEYTRHRRHEEVSLATLSLLEAGVARATELWLFAYDDAGGARLPQPIPIAPVQFSLDSDVFARKRSLITDLYGFGEESWEARAAPRTEAFFSVRPAAEARLRFPFTEDPA